MPIKKNEKPETARVTPTGGARFKVKEEKSIAGRDKLLLKQKFSAGRRLKKSRINPGFLLGSYGGRTYGPLPAI